MTVSASIPSGFLKCSSEHVHRYSYFANGITHIPHEFRVILRTSFDEASLFCNPERVGIFLTSGR
jgi:hypothetical protein